ncbi:MAG: iron-containing alcohol dehydrogenase [Bacillaceae bacterium]
MIPFIFHNPTKLLFGKGMIENLHTEIGEKKKVLVVYGGGSIKQNGVYNDVMEQLHKGECSIFELAGVEPNPRVTTVQKGIDICKRENIDYLLAVGGGSVIDCTKAIGIGAVSKENVWDLITRKAPITGSLPFGVVLTLAATGSEMNANSVITNWEKNEKRGWSSPYSNPTFSILDPTYTFSVPRKQTAYGIVDMMSHIFEHYYHNAPNTPINDSYCEALLRVIIDAGGKLVNDLENYDYRETILYAGTLALNRTLNAGTTGGDWASHQIEHAASAIYDIPHGGGLAILMPNWMRHVATIKPEKFKMMAINVFHVNPEGKTDLDVALEGINALRQFWTSIGAPIRLADYNINDSKLDELVEKTMLGRETVGGYKPLQPDEVRSIFVASF